MCNLKIICGFCTCLANFFIGINVFMGQKLILVFHGGTVCGRGGGRRILSLRVAVVQWIKATVALPEDMASDPKTHIMARNDL